jgi:hypothetical protein
MFAAWNSYGPAFYGTGFCYTNNGGASWTGNTQMLVAGNNGDPGPWIWSTTSSYPGRLGISVIGSAGISATYSTDQGVTWHTFSPVGGSGTDKNLSAVDETTGSPFLGRVYTVWTDFAGAYINRIVGAYSTNGGDNWAGYQPISPVPPAGHHMQGCDVAVGPGGVVYCIWATCTTNGQNSTEDFLGFAKSTDGGVTWPVSNYNVVDINGIRTQNLFNGIRANGFPRIAVDHSGGARNGWIYVTTSEKTIAPARDVSDVTLCRSTDGGTTWTHTLVNSDAAGKYNYLSSVCVDQTNGNMAIGYYDQRNTTSPVTQYYVSWSANGGNSFNDVQVSDHNFTPAPIPGLAAGYQGDYTGITYSNGKFFPFWMDNSSGVYNVWTCAMNPVVLSHDWACGPFLGLPPTIINGTSANIKVRISNIGTTGETAVPVKFFVNGTLVNTTNKDLVAGQVDSVNNVWTPTVNGTYNLMNITALATDQDRTNDTARATVNVVTSSPTICYFNCMAATYAPITGSPGPVGDDVGMTANIGFTFNWVGRSYTQVWICTNGFIRFGPTGGTAYQNDLCTTDTTLQNIIAPFWDDLNAQAGSIVYNTVGSPGNRSFVVQFTNVNFFSGSGNVTFQLRLHEDGFSSEIIYGPSSGNPSAAGSVGANAAPGGSGYIVSVTAGTNCSNTTFSYTTCNNSVPYNLASGTNFWFCHPMGITNSGNTVPTSYSLSQNYPNPFNPATVISFGIPKAGIVKLAVYDILGRTVATLVDEYKQAGNYKTDFDGTNLASGVYFYKLESGDFTANKKMLLVK